MNTITKTPLHALLGVAAVTSLLASSAVAPYAAAQDRGDVRQEFFGLTGVTIGQFARLNVAVIGPSQDDLAPRLCPVRLAFFGADGAELMPAEFMPAEFNVPEGESRSLEFRRPLRTLGTLLVRASVEVSPPDPDVSPPDPDLPPCTLLSTLEIVDALTGRTTVMLVPAVHIDPTEPDSGFTAP